MRLKKGFLIPLIGLAVLLPSREAHADMFGADIPVLLQILAQTIQELAEMRQIFVTGQDTLGLLQDINKGLENGLSVVQIINPKFNPGVYGNLYNSNQVLNSLQDIYGQVPNTADAKLESTQDQSVAESIAMNGNLYNYADQVDSVSQQILAQAQLVNPKGAARLQAQSIAVLIGVTTQLLRTNSTMMKLMAENLALSNRREKMNAEQYQLQYNGLSDAFSSLPTETQLPTVNGSL